MEHSKEPWVIDYDTRPDGAHQILDAELFTVCFMATNQDDIDHPIRNSERLTVCVNALSGIADPAGFVEAAKEIAERVEVGLAYKVSTDLEVPYPNRWSIPVETMKRLRKAWKCSVESAIAEIVKDVPDETLDELPADGAAELDHHLYGTPKKGE